MAVTIYNHALTGFCPVNLTEYGFTLDSNENYSKTFKFGESETIEILATGDTVNLHARITLSATLTVNGQVYAKDENTSRKDIELNNIVLTEPIKIESNGKTCKVWFYTLEKYDILPVTDEQFSNMHLYFPFSPTGETLEAATADFTVYTTNAANWAKGTVIDIHDSAGILGRFYIDTCTKTYAGQYAITASDIIAQLANDTFYGYIGYDERRGTNLYTFTKNVFTVEQVAAAVFGNRAHTVSESCKDSEVYGYIPFGNAKDALQLLCMGNGLNVRTYRTATPIIQSADSFATYTIPAIRVADSVSVSEKDAQTAVSVKMRRYIEFLTDERIYDGYLPLGETLLTIGAKATFPSEKNHKPVDYKFASREVNTYSQYGNVVKTTGVSTIVNTIESTTSEDSQYLMVLHGGVISIRYCDTAYASIGAGAYDDDNAAIPYYKQFGSGSLLQLSDDATTVTVHNAETVANRMIAYHGKSREANITYVMSANEMPGDKLILPLDKTYGNISGRIISLDITPGVTKTFADAVIICDEEDENA